MAERAKTPPNKRPRAASGAPATDGRSRSLWFDAPIDDPDRRPQLTRQRVVAEALAVIAQDGVQAMSMRALAARLGVVPGALYHHFGNKQQLQDLVLDGVLAEFYVTRPHPWTQPSDPAHRLRQSSQIRDSRESSDPRPAGPPLLTLAESPVPAAGGQVRDRDRPAFFTCSTTPLALPSAFLVPRSRATRPDRVEPAASSSVRASHRFRPGSPSRARWVDNRDERFTPALMCG